MDRRRGKVGPPISGGRWQSGEAAQAADDGRLSEKAVRELAEIMGASQDYTDCLIEMMHDKRLPK